MRIFLVEWYLVLNCKRITMRGPMPFKTNITGVEIKMKIMHLKIISTSEMSQFRKVKFDSIRAINDRRRKVKKKTFFQSTKVFTCFDKYFIELNIKNI
jgi:hypothetical protein